MTTVVKKDRLRVRIVKDGCVMIAKEIRHPDYSRSE